MAEKKDAPKRVDGGRISQLFSDASNYVHQAITAFTELQTEMKTAEESVHNLDADMEKHKEFRKKLSELTAQIKEKEEQKIGLQQEIDRIRDRFLKG